jgi:hypothetical protein
VFADERARPRQSWEVGGLKVEFSAELYISGPDPVSFPAHKQTWRLESSAGLGVQRAGLALSGTYRYSGYSPSGGRKREYTGPVEVLASNELRFHGSGPVSATSTQQVDPALGAAMQNWAVANLAVDLHGPGRAEWIRSVTSPSDHRVLVARGGG